MFKVLAIGFALTQAAFGVQISHADEEVLQKVGMAFHFCNLNRNDILEAGEEYICFDSLHEVSFDLQEENGDTTDKKQLTKLMLIEKAQK